MPRGLPSYTDDHADLFRLLANKDRLAVYGCLHRQGQATLPELCRLMSWDGEDGTPDTQAMRRHLKALYDWGVVIRVEDGNLWLSDEETLKEWLVQAINVLC
jgi:hypothetical protein